MAQIRQTFFQGTCKFANGSSKRFGIFPVDAAPTGGFAPLHHDPGDRREDIDRDPIAADLLRVFQCAMVLGWIAFNVGLAPAHWPFDPYPFPLLAVVLGLEAVLLTSFVLIRQNAIDRRSERRNHLDLQINLLAEEEATKVLKMLGEIAVHLKLPVHDPHNKDLSQDTQVESIARDLRAREKKETE